MPFQGKHVIQTQENGKKPHFGPDLVSLGPNSRHKNSFCNLALLVASDIMVSYNHV